MPKSDKKQIGKRWAIVDKYIRNIEKHGFKTRIGECDNNFFLEISHDNFSMELHDGYEIEKIALLLDEYNRMMGLGDN